METNKEHYSKEILDIACAGDLFAYVEGKGVAACGKISCAHCKFTGNCYEERKKWVNRLYLPAPKAEEWIVKWYNLYVNDNKVKRVVFVGEKTAAKTIIVDYDGKTAVSPKYRIEDEVAYTRSIAIAYAKYCGEKIPREVLKK